jgi:hypothetical protein
MKLKLGLIPAGSSEREGKKKKTIQRRYTVRDGGAQPRALPRLSSASSLCTIVLVELNKLTGMAQKILRLY